MSDNMEDYMMMTMDPLVGRMEQVRKLTLDLKEADDDQYNILLSAINILLDSCEMKTKKECTFTPDPNGNVTPFN